MPFECFRIPWFCSKPGSPSFHCTSSILLAICFFICSFLRTKSKILLKRYYKQEFCANFKTLILSFFVKENTTASSWSSVIYIIIYECITVTINFYNSKVDISWEFKPCTTLLSRSFYRFRKESHTKYDMEWFLLKTRFRVLRHLIIN